MNSPLLLQQCPAYLARLVWMVFEMGGKCPYSCCFVGCCLQDLFNTARRILGQLPSSFHSIRLVSVHVVHPYSSIDTTPAWKKNALFYLIGLTSIWPIVNRWLLMPLLVAFWCHSRLMRRCFWGRWTSPQISETFHLVWRCRLFD